MLLETFEVLVKLAEAVLKTFVEVDWLGAWVLPKSAWHVEKYGESLYITQVSPALQHVGPVKPIPPHWLLYIISAK